MRRAACLSFIIVFSLLAATAIAQPGPQKGGSAARESSSVTRKESELDSLLKRLEESDDLQKDREGLVIGLALHSTNANDQNLSLVSTLQSLKELTIQGRGWPASNRWTLEGISSLERMTNLTTVRILCQSVPEMNVQFLPALSRLTQL